MRINYDNEDLIIRYIETTGKCDNKCPICTSRIRNFDMPYDEFCKIVDANMDILKGQRVWLDFSGEPLMDATFFDKVRYMTKNGVITQISTNGNLLTDKNCYSLATSGIDYIVVSVLSLDPDVFKKLRGKDNLDDILSNIDKLKSYIDTYSPNVSLQAVATDIDGLDRNAFINHFHRKGIHAAIHKFTTRSNHITDIYETHHCSLPKRSICEGLLKNIVIMCNGEVTMCCSDFYGENSLGNIKDYDYSIRKLLKNGNYEKFIDNQRNNNYIGACKMCNTWMYHQKDSVEEYVELFTLEY